MEWRDQGALLARRLHGETSVIIEVFTPEHGRHAGVVRGGTSRRTAPLLQAGNQIDVVWKARLEDHLGAFTVEPVHGRTAAVMSDKLALAGLNSICALLSFALPEREPYPDLYAKTIALLDMFGETDLWPTAYLQWELLLLQEMGFGLDLTSCAATGATNNLAYISPRTGRAVTEIGAGDWADRLLPLPPALLGLGQGAYGEICEALAVTGHFFEQHLAPSLGNTPIPAARQRLIDTLIKSA